MSLNKSIEDIMLNTSCTREEAISVKGTFEVDSIIRYSKQNKFTKQKAIKAKQTKIKQNAKKASDELTKKEKRLALQEKIVYTNPFIFEAMQKYMLTDFVNASYRSNDMRDSSKVTLAKNLTQLYLDAIGNPRIFKGKFEGYYVYGDRIKQSKRLPFFTQGKHISETLFYKEFMRKAADSSYCSFPLAGKIGAHPHWYIINTEIHEIYKKAVDDYVQALEKNRKHEKLLPYFKYMQSITEDEVQGYFDENKINEDDYFKKYDEAEQLNEDSRVLRIRKDIYITELKHFMSTFIKNTTVQDVIEDAKRTKEQKFSSSFATIMKHSYKFDNDYVYVLNVTHKAAINGKGRKYTVVSNLNKELRKRLFANHIEIDLNSFAQSASLNLYFIQSKLDMTDANIKYLFPEHFKLLKDKNAYRQQVSYAYGHIGIKKAKKILQTLTYSPDANTIYTYLKDSKLPKSAKSKIKRTAELKMKKFIAEAKVLRNSTLKFASEKTIVINGVKRNMLNVIDEDIAENNKKLKGNGRGKNLSDRRAFRTIELYENTIRKAMIYTAKKHFGIKNVYQIHDCIIVDKMLNTEQFENIISKLTRSNLSFSYEKY